MGGHRGDAAIKALTPMTLRELGIATVCGLGGAVGWKLYIQGNHKEWDRIQRNYEVKKVARREKFQQWLATQPYDDEAAQ